MEHLSARDLLDRCACGPEPTAWDRFVARFGPVIETGVRRALVRRGKIDLDPTEVQDLVQECYCRLLDGGGRRLRTIRGTGEREIRSWLARFAERSARDQLKRRQAAKRGGCRRRALSFPAPAGSLADPAGSPERRAIGRQRLRQFLRRCRRFSRTERDARILQLVYLAGFTSREVAAVSQGTLSPSSVDSVVHRFRRRLEEQGLPLPARAAPPASTGRRRTRRRRRARSARSTEIWTDPSRLGARGEGRGEQRWSEAEPR